MAVADGRSVRIVEADDATDTIGINDRLALAAAEERMRRRIVETHMRNGVTIVDPSTTRIDASVEIGQDARIEPWTILEGATVIAQDAVIGPNAQVRDSRIGPRTLRVGERGRGVDRGRGRADRTIRAPAPGIGDRRPVPDRQLRRGQEQPPRGRNAAASLQLHR